MKQRQRFLALFILLTILAAPAPVAASPASADFLNPDGTLRMEALNGGTLDLHGWDVQLDPRLGPIFRPPALNGTWSALGSGLNDSVTGIAVSGSNVYVGGWFTQAGGSPANYIARWDGTTWSPLGSGLNNPVNVMAVSGSNVYVGGWFTQAGGSPANYIARWDGTTWSPLGSGVNNGVDAIAVSGSNVYVGGWFTQAGGSPANYIARWDGTTWSPLGSGVNNWVIEIAISGSDVYAGGDFTLAGGTSATRIARWDGMNWSALGSGLNERVYGIAFRGTDVYVGGLFTNAGGNPNADYVARWDGMNWSALGSGLNNWVHAVAANSSNIYVGGIFTNAGGDPNADHVAIWDGTTWSALGSGLNDNVYTFAFSGSNAYAGGSFTNAGAISANRIASFLADSMHPTVVFGSGSLPPSEGSNLTVSPSQLVVRFSENVLSDGSQHAANSLWNYMLLRPGPNGIFDTPVSTPPAGIDPICDSDHVQEGDDERIDLLNATYNAANFAATLTIDPFYAPLSNGTYRLYVCGAASVDDLAGNPLNGGSNTAINFTIGPAAVIPPAQQAAGRRVPNTGFAPGWVTLLPPQTVPYVDLGNLWLEVPKLGVKMSIVGVPKQDNEWNVSWLGSNAGWLEGSAYPSWKGNSVLTGHVWNADNSAGPFRYLNTLWWGDKIIVHLAGQQYVYEVRSAKEVKPTDVSAMLKHEELAWLTLVTCKGYDEDSGEYRSRVLVRAVLVEVK